MEWLKNSYKGRINYFICALITGTVLVFGMILISLIIRYSPMPEVSYVLYYPIQGVWMACVFIFAFSLYARRWHDFGRSGWCSFLCLVPIINLIAGLMLLIYPGDEGENKYGKPPESKIDIKGVFTAMQKMHEKEEEQKTEMPSSTQA